MRNDTRLNASRSARHLWLSASAAALTAVAAAAGIAAGPGNAAPGRYAAKASYAHKADRFKHPKLQHGVLTIEGTDAGDRIALRLAAGDSGVLQVDVGDDGTADFSVARAEIGAIVVNGGDGDDLVRIDDRNGAVNAGTPTTIRGGDGDDTLAGGSGNETLRGGDGNDAVDGNGGTDVGLLGDGDDTFVWDPGDGSDVVEGQDGHDTMLFNGAGGAEQFDLSANGHRLRFFRTQGAITMDTQGVERVDVNALGGADTVTVNDLRGTDVSAVNVDLAGALGGATGDGQPDRVVVNGTDRDDRIDVSGDASEVKVSGLAATTRILHSEVANDRLEVNTLAGTDSVESVGLDAGAIQLFVDGVLVP
ncbi:MAG TPA: calcium-binding protein [Gaiella sp.]